MAGMGITEERDEVIDFTQNYVPPSPSIYVGLTEDVDVASATVAAQTNTLQAALVAESGATLLEFATQDEALAAVQAGEADAFFADSEALAPAVEAAGGSLVQIGEPIPVGGGVAVGLRESDTELKETLDAAITAMKEDGSLNALLAQWFGDEPPQY
jgi:polar amino acid transport system substrate-binding protein